MDAAWIGTISALSGAALGGAITGYLDWRRANREKARDEAQRLFDRRERRYADRRSAYERYMAVLLAIDHEYFAMMRPDYDGDGGGTAGREFEQALAALRLVAGKEALASAEACSEKFWAWTHRSEGYTPFAEETVRFTELARRELEAEA